MIYAPILVSVYNRHTHFQKCIESLMKNDLADKSHLFIVIDAPYKDEHRADCQKVVDYAKSIKGFKEVTLFLNEKNLGSHRSHLTAQVEVFNYYDKLIFSEDDNIFSTSFLSFVNRGLEVYRDRVDIFSISGYNFPIKMPKGFNKDIYIWTGFSAWGVGLWKYKFEKVDWKLDNIATFLKDRKEIKGLNNVAHHYLPKLKEILNSGQITGDTVICYYLYKNKFQSVFPSVSRVRNCGHDGSGEHCVISEIYVKQRIFEGKDAGQMPLDISPDLEINKLLWQHFKIKNSTKIKLKLKSFIGSVDFNLKSDN